MKIKKLLALMVCGIIALGATACITTDSTDSSTGDGPDAPAFVAKPVDGIAPLFDEGMGYYNIQPSILYEDANTMHVYYTVNETFEDTDSVIGYKKGTLENGVWTFGEKKIVLRKGEETAWDGANISNCDVVKGEFNYNGEVYNYLMAYQGGSNNNHKNYQIGFAVSKTADGEFVKVGTAPVVSYDDVALGYSWGIGQPSLVSYEGGKVYLFYTMGDALATQTYVSELDASNLNDIKGVNVYNSISTDGLLENNIYVMLNDADFAIDTTNGILYVVRNYNPAATSAPSLNTAVQVAKVALADLYKPNCVWEIIDEKVNLLDLATEETGGWERVYSGCIASDAYGHVNGATAIELGLTVTSWDNTTKDYTHYQTIITYTISLGE